MLFLPTTAREREMVARAHALRAAAVAAAGRTLRAALARLVRGRARGPAGGLRPA